MPRSSRASRAFPTAHRDVAPIVGGTFSTEDARDRLGEAEEVMQLAGVKPGHVGRRCRRRARAITRSACRRVVGAKGRVLAEDIVPEVRDQLSERVQRENLDNVAVKLGTPDDPMLPPQSFDRVFLVHMYHEVQSPYAFLWHLREGAEARTASSSSSIPTGRLSATASRPSSSNASSPRSALEPVKFSTLAGGDAYFMAFRAGAARGRRPTRSSACRDLKLAPAAQAGALVSGEHQMVEHRAVERLGRDRQPAGGAAVGIARPRIAARMVVGEDDPGAADAARRRR